MKKLKINMNEAFKLRNKIKAKISELSYSILRAQLFVDPDLTEEESLRAFDGEQFDSVVTKAERLMDFLCDLNTAIDKANVTNRANLNALETLKVKSNLNRDILSIIRSSSVFQTNVNSVTGETTKIRLRQIFSNSAIYIEKEKSFSRQKEELEQQVAISNSNTIFELEVDEQVYDSIFE